MKGLLLFSFGVFALTCSGQSKVDVKIDLLSKPGDDPSEWVFKVRVLNRGFDKYWVKDTIKLQKGMWAPSINHIYPFIEVKKENKYISYSNSTTVGIYTPDTTSEKCDKCIILSKGDSVTFSINLLRTQMLEKGDYRVVAALRPPMDICISCEQHAEVVSNKLYFSLNETPKNVWDKIKSRQ